MKRADQFNILIVDPDQQGRSMLLHATKASDMFDRAYVEDSLKNALELSEDEDGIDLVVLSHRFPIEDINAFIEEAKQNRCGEEWAYMAILKPQEQDGLNIAKNVINGIDGFLFDPYSADDLYEMAKITETVKKQNAEKRFRTALDIIMAEILDHLDAAALLKAKDRDPRLALKSLKKSCDGIKKFTHENFDLYLEVATAHFERAKPPASATYDGPSERIKKRLEQRDLKKLEEKYGGG